MNSKIITGACMLSLICILGACGPINETYEQVEFTETTVPVTTTSTTTTLTSPVTTLSEVANTVTSVNSTPVFTEATPGYASVTEPVSEKPQEKPQVNMQVNMQDNTQDNKIVPLVCVTSTPITTTTSQLNTTTVTTLPTDNVTSTSSTATEITTTPTEITTCVTTTEPIVTTQNNEPYLVYKPSTKYAHRSTCRWNKDDAYKCDDFSNLETRICSECNPEVGDHIEYQAPTVDSSDKTYLGNFHMTYYPETAYYPGVCGGSGRTLRGYGDYSDGIRGSVACRTIQESYGYDRNGRTTVYLEFPSYPCMNGTYWVDDCCGAYGTIDVFVWSDAACPFGYDGVTRADCWIY